MRACSVISTTTRAPSLPAISRRNPGVGERGGRDVDRQEDVLGQIRQGGQRRAHGRQLQLAQQPDLVGLGEPAHRATRRRAAEARQRLGADGRPGERADGLEDHAQHAIVVERAADALLAAPRALLGAPPGVQQAGELLDHAAGDLDREAALPVRGPLDRRDDGCRPGCP